MTPKTNPSGTLKHSGRCPERLIRGGLCPALEKRRSPVLKFNKPQKRVTNIDDSFSRQSSLLTWLRTREGSVHFSASRSKRVFATAMKRAAGTPLPETSPTRKKRWSSPKRKKSYRSP